MTKRIITMCGANPAFVQREGKAIAALAAALERLADAKARSGLEYDWRRDKRTERRRRAKAGVLTATAPGPYVPDEPADSVLDEIWRRGQR